MKRLLVIAALLGVMLLLEGFRSDGTVAGQPMTLAAIGFVVLASFATAELGSSLTLPRVTGYILAGVALGPSVGNILSGQVVTEMRMFNTLALGLIATSAGLELDLAQIRRLGRTLSATILFKVLLGVTLVGGAVYGIAGVLDLGLSADQLTGRSSIIALSLVMGVLSIGTSPAIALAVLNETRAKGRLADLVLGAAIFKDLVVVVCLALAIAVARTLLVPDAQLDSSVLVHVGTELGGSLVAGALLGGVLIAYVRFVRAEMLLFVAAMILVVAELCRALHLELLLVFITAGFVVRNFSKYEHDLMAPLELVAMPVFVVFFTNAGAGLDLAGTWQILPAAGALCGARALAYYVASRWGAKIGKEAEPVVKNAWFAYLPQAGVTLGLVGLAGQQLPALGGAIATTGMAVVAINLLVGPVALRKALQIAGEIPDAPQPAASGKATSPAAVPTPVAPKPTLEHEELKQIVAQLQQAVHERLEDYRDEVLPSLKTLPDSGLEPSFAEFESFVARHRVASRGLFEDLRGLLRAVPNRLTVELTERDLRRRASDGRVLRWRSTWLSIMGAWLPRYRRRRVDARLAARMTLEPAFARLTRAAFESNIYHPLPSAADERARTAELLNDEGSLEDAFVAFEALLSEIGTPRKPARAERFSTVEPEITAAIEPLVAPDDAHWAERAQAAWGSTLSKGHLSQVESQVSAIVDTHVTLPCQAVAEKVPVALSRLRDYLRALEETLTAEGDEATAPEGSAPAVDALDEWRRSIDQLRRDTLEDIAREFRATAAVRSVLQEMKQVVSDLPQQMRCLQLSRDGQNADASIRRIELRSMAERHLIRAMIPVIDQSARSASNLFARLPSRVEQAVSPSWDALASAGARLDTESFRHRAAEELDLAAHRLGLIERRLARQLDRTLQEIPAALLLANKALSDGVQLHQSEGSTRTRRFERLRERAHAAAGVMFTWVRRFRPSPLRDASETRRALEVWQGGGLPPNLQRWFEQAPVVDERVFTAHRELLEAVIDEEVSWSGGRPGAVLVRGALGSGKSSLLNISALELRNTRVLRLDGLDREQSGLLRTALAATLGCNDSDSSLRHQLEEQKPAIVVDNLQAWVARAPRPASELAQLLLLIAQTRGHAFWLVAVDSAAFSVLEEVGEVAEGFSRVLDCGGVGALELRQAVEARCARAGVELHFRRTLIGDLLTRLGLAGEVDLFFKRLASVSDGNLAAAIAAFTRAAAASQDGLLLDTRRLSARPPSLEPILTTAQLALLHVVTRLQSCDLERLHHELGLPHEQLERHVAYLNSAGLIAFGSDSLALQVPQAAQWAVLPELSRAGVMNPHGSVR